MERLQSKGEISVVDAARGQVLLNIACWVLQVGYVLTFAGSQGQEVSGTVLDIRWKGREVRRAAAGSIVVVFLNVLGTELPASTAEATWFDALPTPVLAQDGSPDVPVPLCFTAENDGAV